MKQKLGNPLIAAASNPDIVKAGKDIIITTQQRALDTGKTIVGLVGGAFTLWYANKAYKKWRKQKFIENNANIADVQAAMIMRKAMKRFEFDTWLFGLVTIPDGTNEALLNKLAMKVTSLQAVINAYKILFESNLVLDVYDELDDVELQKFYESLGAKNDWASQFDANGHVKPQKPFKIGYKIQVKNPNGTTIYVAEQKPDSTYKATNVSRNFLNFSDNIGTILQVYKGTSGQYYYLVDMDDWSFGADWIYGHGWVGHTEVKLQN